jgi:hypothetical protein
MTTKKSNSTRVSETSVGTRRDVMKLSMAVAAFGAAMGIAGPGAAQSASKIKLTDVVVSATEGKVKGKVKTSGDREQTRHKGEVISSGKRSQDHMKKNANSKANPDYHLKKNAN